MSHVKIFPIPEIAAWALPHASDEPPLESLAVLPYLQRGPVWKAEQVEQIWDSLVRGFPVGSFLLSPYKESLGKKHFRTQGNNFSGVDADQKPDWHLLDGQQRVAAIALGFYNPWTNLLHKNAGKINNTLWVDLDPTDGPDGFEFLFRLATPSHPWGYQRRLPEKPLRAGMRLDAIDELEKATAGRKFRAGKLPIEAIPYDARAPVPIAMLIECVNEPSVWTALQQRLANVWPQGVMQEGRRGNQRDSVFSLLTSEPTRKMQLLKDGVHRLVSNTVNEPYKIPGLIVGDTLLIQPDASETEQTDPLATLFIRVNSAGTVPNQEEMAYSLLKSIVPKCHTLIDELPHTFLPPAQMVAQFITLLMARADQEAEKGNAGEENTRGEKPPRFPDLPGFRRLVGNKNELYKDILDRVEEFIDSDTPARLIRSARHVLVLDDANRSFRLLPAHAAQLAQSNRRVFFLFLSWVDSRLDQQAPWLGLDEEAHRRLIGVITTLSWFAQYEEDCITLLWPHRSRLHEPGILQKLIGVHKGRLPLLPLLPPKILQSVVRDRVTGVDGLATFNFDPNDASNIWNNWNWSYFAKAHHDETTEVYRWYVNPANLPLGEWDNDAVIWRSQAWANFVGNLKSNRNLVLYAQREVLNQWFGTVDPTSTNKLEDTDRPWDFDHIHANYFTAGVFYIPQIIKDWHGTIGNLRAWPAELNRSDNAIPPADKLCRPEGREKDVYELKGESDIIRASEITEAELKLWVKSCPEDRTPKYLAGLKDNERFNCNRIALLDAITGRWIRLYDTWYRELRVAELMGAATYQS